MYWALIVLHVIVCSFLVLVVLLQAGKGGGMGIAFGGGGSQTVFGSSGAGNFLTRLTAICAAIFFLNSLALAYLSSQSDTTRLQRIAEKKAAAKKLDDDAKAKLDKTKALEDINKAKQAPTPITVGAGGAAGAQVIEVTTPPAAEKPTEKPATDKKVDTKTEKAKPEKPTKAEKPASEPEKAPEPAPKTAPTP
jgi:preprotein translocase subunit SecG